MDGISNIAAIVGLVQAATQATTALNRYISRVKRAESSCERLRRQINLIFAVEKAIKATIQGPSPSFRTPELQTAIDEWFSDDSLPNQCKARLEELSAWIENQVESSRSSKSKKWLNRIVWPVREDKIEETIKAFNEYVPHFILIVSLVNHASVNEAAGSKKVEHAAAKSEVLSWFDGFDCTNKQESTLRQRQKQTGDWLFKDKLYIDWRTGSTKFIWLHGKPGAGKSVLASAVIDNLLSSESDKESLAYFYFDFRNARCTTAMEVLRSLIKQLLWNSKKDWLSSFSDLTTRKERGAEPPTDLHVLLDLLNRVMGLHERPIIVIDALDECEDLSNLLSVTKLSHGGFRLFVTSRPLHTIKEAFGDNCATISLDDRVDEMRSDISLHIGVELKSRSRLKSYAQDVKDEIQGVLMMKADGMFRWAQCQLDRLNDCYSRGDIREVLDTLPETLHETYDQMLHAIDKKPFGPRIARRALMWLVAALRPLELSELAEVLALRTDEPAWDSDHAPMDEQVILEILGSFVVTDHTGMITLSHYSVKEYLTSHTLADKAYYVLPQDASLELAKCSIFALILHQGGNNHLSSYADDCGLQHLADCDTTHNETLVGHILTLQNHISTNPPGYEFLYKSRRNLWMMKVQQVALHIILCYGHLSMLGHYLGCHSVQAMTEENPLVFAALYSSIASVQLLLEKGLDVNLKGPMYSHTMRKTSPLIAAARHKTREHQDPLVRLLLTKGCVVPRDVIHAVFSLPLYAPCNPAVVQVLLDHGADPKSLTSGNNSALHLLFQSDPISPKDQLEIARMLIGAGCDPALLNDEGHSPLTAAARQYEREWQEPLLRFLLGKGCIVPRDAIHTFLSCRLYAPCNPAVVQALLDHGADPKLLATGNNTTLHLLFESNEISLEDQLEVAKMLIGAGCDPTVLNDKGHSPLTAAARQSEREYQEPLLRFLLGKGCIVPRDAIHTFLSCRSYAPCNPAVVQALLDHGADPKLLATGNNTTLHLLFESNGISLEDLFEVAKMLIGAGCDPTVLNDKGHSPLTAATRQSEREWQEPLLRFLLGKGCIVPRDAIHATLSSHLYTPYDPAVVQILLHHGADPKLLAAGNNSALHLLFESNGISPEDHLEIARILVRTGCDPAALNDQGHLPSHVSTSSSSFKSIEWLTDLGSPVSADAILHLPFGASDIKELSPMFRFLVKHGALPSAKDESGHNALHLFCKSARSILRFEPFANTFRFLVELGCDINCRNKKGKTPFHLALPHSHSSRMVDLFLSQGAEIPADIVNHVVANHLLATGQRAVIAALTSLRRYGANFRYQTQAGGSALHCLLEYSRSYSPGSILTIASFLIESGCDIDATYLGVTPLELAIENGQFPVAETLLAQVASRPFNESTGLFHNDIYGNSILHRLLRDRADGKFMDKIKFLREVGYDFTRDINRRNHNGIAPLDMALVCHTDPVLVKSLLDLGGSFKHVDYVYLDNLQWASNLPWYHDATDARRRYTFRSNIACGDVIQVHHLLRGAHRRGISPVVVSSILEMAEYWACVKIIRHNIRYEAAHREGPIVFPTVPGEMTGWIPRRVVFACKASTLESNKSLENVYLNLHVIRRDTKFRVPLVLTPKLSSFNPPETSFVVWDGFQPAFHEDTEQKIVVEELLPGDTLSVGLDPYSDDDHITLEFFQIDVYYSMKSLIDECD